MWNPYSMGNRLSGLWCKKTTLSITHEDSQKESEETRNVKGRRSRRKSSAGTGDGRGTFRIGSVRRLSLSNCVSRDNNPKKPLCSEITISTVEKTYRELTNQADLDSDMKVNAQLMPTVKVSSSPRNSFAQKIRKSAIMSFVVVCCLHRSDLNSNRNRYACRGKNKRQTWIILICYPVHGRKQIVSGFFGWCH